MTERAPCFMSKKWRWFWVMIVLMLCEFAGTVATLALFGVASPNAYRTQMWKVGGEHGFNSKPSQILYAYANFQQIPKTSMVWSQFITDFNVIVSVLSMFILLVKAVLFIMHMWIPLLALIINIITTALWCVSVYGQAGPDYSDPKRPSKVAWYITKSCDFAVASGNKHNCNMAKGSFAASVLMLAVFFFNTLLSIYSLLPTQEQREKRAAKRAAQSDDDSFTSATQKEKLWELRHMPATPGFQPYTPRTMAFNTLDRQLPLLSERYQ